MATEPLRILFFDIETAPNLGAVWQAKVEYVNYGMMERDWFFLSWSAKWRGEDWIYSDVLTGKEALKQDDSRIVASLADMVREADVIVAHNGDSFDIPKLNARLLLNGLEPIGPVQSVDTKTWATKAFRLTYNKLDYLAEKLLGSNKIHTDFDLWRACYNGDEEALAQMLAYNEQDTVLLEGVFEALLPYVKNAPRLIEPAFKGEDVCPFCGSSHRIKRGFKRTAASTWQLFQCTDCNRYHRAVKAEPRSLSTRPA